MIDEVQLSTLGRLGVITLNRPKALNALSLPMVRAIRAGLDRWALDDAICAVVLTSSATKALCAGGDIRFFYETQRIANAGGAEGGVATAILDEFFTEEYALNHLIATYKKPYIALMQGVVMGGGMGLAETARLRIVCENSKIAMPEVNIGLFPDVGGTHFLARLPQQIGQYLGQTGAVLGAADSLYAGLVDTACSTAALAELMIIMQEASESHTDGATDTVGESVLAAAKAFCRAQTTALGIDTTGCELAANAELINSAFSQAPQAALATLHTAAAAGNAFAARAANLMQSRSPLMIKVTHAAIEQAKQLTLAQALRQERHLIKNNLEHAESLEGMRALVVDKDQKPQWRHASLPDVQAAEVAAMFTPRWTPELHPLRDLV